MGSSKGTSTTVQNTTQTVERELSAEEKRLLQLEVQGREATAPAQTALNLASLDTATRLIKGEVPTGLYGDLYAGISPEITQDIVKQSLRDINPQFQQAGIIDSGVAAEISARTAGDIRRATEEFNIGNRLNLLNLALSGQAQVQTPVLNRQALLNQQLVSSSPITTTGTSTGTTTTKTMNPFLQSFQTSFGQSLGSGSFGSAWKTV